MPTARCVPTHGEEPGVDEREPVLLDDLRSSLSSRHRREPRSASSAAARHDREPSDGRVRFHLSGRFDRLPLRSPQQGRLGFGRRHTHIPSHGEGHVFGAHERDARVRAHRGDRIGRRTRRPTTSRSRVTTTSSPKASSSTTPKSSTTATARSSPSRGSCSATWTPPCASTPTSSSGTSARSSRRATTSSPRSTRRCGSGGSFIYVPPGVERRDAAAGLLPDQLGERRPVRAHADHRRRGLAGALHRGLLGAGVHQRLAALGRRRDHRQAERPGDLHDDPELEPERLQPRHQAGPGRGRGPHGVDRRQHRLEAHDEVPERLPRRPEGDG